VHQSQHVFTKITKTEKNYPNIIIEADVHRDYVTTAFMKKTQNFTLY